MSSLGPCWVFPHSISVLLSLLHTSLHHAKHRHDLLVLLLCWICWLWKSGGSHGCQILGYNTTGSSNLWAAPWFLPFLLQFIRNKLISCWNKWVLQVLQIAFVVCLWGYECGMKLRRTCLDLGGSWCTVRSKCDFLAEIAQQNELFNSPEKSLEPCRKAVTCFREWNSDGTVGRQWTDKQNKRYTLAFNSYVERYCVQFSSHPKVMLTASLHWALI